jgi:hypothetical protein
MQVRQVTVSIPPGTTPDNPITIDTSISPGTVYGVQFFIPPGNAGLVQFYLGNGGQRIIPFDDNEWIQADNVILSYMFTQAIDNGSYTLTASNLGSYPHSITIQYLLGSVPSKSSSSASNSLVSTGYSSIGSGI